MKVRDLRDAEGTVFGFEVSNFLFTRAAAIRIIESIPGVEVIEIDTQEDHFCDFIVDNAAYVIWEPFGDNPIFSVAPRYSGHSDEILRPLPKIRLAFERANRFSRMFF